VATSHQGGSWLRAHALPQLVASFCSTYPFCWHQFLKTLASGCILSRSQVFAARQVVWLCWLLASWGTASSHCEPLGFLPRSTWFFTLSAGGYCAAPRQGWYLRWLAGQGGLRGCGCERADVQRRWSLGCSLAATGLTG
jgi:hypothetical protein